MPTVSGSTVANQLIKKFNVDQNDNKAFSGWSRSTWTTRTVLGAAESKKILTAVKKLPLAQQKAVLKAIAGRIDKTGGTVGSLYIQPDGQSLFKKLADKLGVQASFVGNARPPMVMG
jgi:hypothetical protein